MNKQQRNDRLSFVGMLGLASLGVPRVIAHDLHWVDSGSIANLLLVFVPPAIWIAVVLKNKSSRPFTDLLTVGILYGVLLGITHQLLWHIAFPSPPQLGGNLSDLSPAATAIVTRTFGFLSSLVTGAITGGAAGLVGLVLKRILPR